MSHVINLLIIMQSAYIQTGAGCVFERGGGTQVNKTGELSLKCDCTPQCNSSDVGDAVALLDC